MSILHALVSMKLPFGSNFEFWIKVLLSDPYSHFQQGESTGTGLLLTIILYDIVIHSVAFLLLIATCMEFFGG